MLRAMSVQPIPQESVAKSTSDRRETLASVLAILPPSCYENPTWRGLVWLARDLAVYAAIVAAIVWTDSIFLLVPLWIIAGIAISGLFILGHDAAHGSLFKNRKLGRFVGQLAMLPSLHMYEAWVFGHNRIHHGHTTRQTMDYVWHPTSPAEYAALSRTGKLLHRLKWSYLGAGLYYGWDIWWKSMMMFDMPAKIAPKVRRERIMIAAYATVVSAAVLAWGAASYGTAGGALWMWVKVLGIPFVTWNYSIGAAVYVHHIAQDITWYGRREWTKFRGQMEGTTTLHIPAWLNFFYHNIFLHVAHHVDMRIPFYGLPAATDALREHYPDVVRERDYKLTEYVRTTKHCKLFDFEKGEWQGYPNPKSTESVAATA